MKLGYSILLGETIEANRIQYRDCERFQIVCPQCKEPIFKVRRGAESPDETHYLAHYAAAAAYHGDCELRVSHYQKGDLERHNSQARDQRLAYFLSVLRRTLGMSPLYATTAEKSHWRLNNAPALELLRNLVWEKTVLPNRESLFDEGAEDFLWQLDESGWALATSFSLDRQRQIARDMWLTITTTAGHGNYNFLWNHAFIREVNSIAMALDQESTQQEREVSVRMGAYMAQLVDVKKGQVAGLLDEMAASVLPDSFNLVRGELDLSNRSTYFTRMLSNITIESIGALMELPYFELLKQQYGDPSKVYPYVPGVEPVDADEIARMKAFQARNNGKGRVH